MLDKLLSNKVFFVQIIIILCASLLGLLLINTNAFIHRYWIAVVLFAINWYFVFFYIHEDESLKENSYAVWFYSIWMIPFLHFFIDYRFAVALLLLNFVMIKVLEFENEKNDTKNAFDIGLFLALASLFIPPLIIFFPFLFAYFLSLRGIDKTIGWMFFIGFLIPILGFIQITYLLDYDFLINYYTGSLMISWVEWNNYYLLLIPIAILIVISFVDHFMHENKQAANRKRMYVLLLLFAAIILTIFALFAADQTFYLAFLGLPISIMISKYLKHRKEDYLVYKNIVLIGFLVFMVLFAFLNKMPKIYSLFGEITI